MANFSRAAYFRKSLRLPPTVARRRSCGAGCRSYTPTPATTRCTPRIDHRNDRCSAIAASRARRGPAPHLHFFRRTPHCALHCDLEVALVALAARLLILRGELPAAVLDFVQNLPARARTNRHSYGASLELRAAHAAKPRPIAAAALEPAHDAGPRLKLFFARLSTRRSHDLERAEHMIARRRPL